MSRSHGRILTRIWDDPEFLALDDGHQRMYLFLLSQPDLSHAGLIPLRLKRWASKAVGLSPDSVLLMLKGLEAARFVLVDEDTEEVLVRTLVRNDDVYRQPKVMIRMAGDARQIASPKLRSAFVTEMKRLPLHELDKETQRQVAREVVAALIAEFGEPKPFREGYAEGISEGYGEGYRRDDVTAVTSSRGGDQPDAAYAQVDTHAEGYREGYPEGFSEGYAIPPACAHARSPFPLPPSPTPQEPSPSPAAALPLEGVTPGGATDRPAMNLDEQFSAFWSAYPRKVGKQDARKVWDRQRRTVAPAVILAGAVRYRDDPNRQDEFTAHPATWLRRGGWDDEPLPARRAARTAQQQHRDDLDAAWERLPDIYPDGDPWTTPPQSLPARPPKEIE